MAEIEADVARIEMKRTEAEIEVALSQAPLSRWSRLFMPSVADLVFLVSFYFLSVGAWGPRLLDDADTGWHIRNGEHILASHAVPRSDYFSYTMAGKPWFAWEWLYDLVVGGIHRVSGLNGVVVFSAVVIAFGLGLLCHMTFRRSGNLPIAAALTLATGAAASIHFLARPHLLTWIFVLVWFALLKDFESDARGQRLVWMPVLMVGWVNLHGGFLLGLVLPLVFIAASLWEALAASSEVAARRHFRVARIIAVFTLASAAVTLVNPYGWSLYVHLREYLGSGFMMANINEFQSPDFHFVQAKFFVALLLLAIVTLGAVRNAKASDILLVCFSAVSGFYAARNIPISCMLLALTTAPLLAQCVRQARERAYGRRLGDFITGFEDFSQRMGALERQLKWHVLPLISVLAVFAIALHGGRVFATQVLDLNFNSTKMPVGAVDYLEANHIPDSVFTEDSQGGYLIYRLHPSFRVFVDDRHDFYGEAFLRDYLDAVKVRPNWKEVLDKFSVKYALVAPDSALSTVLQASPDWRAVYTDRVAVIYARRSTQLAAMRAVN